MFPVLFPKPEDGKSEQSGNPFLAITSLPILLTGIPKRPERPTDQEGSPPTEERRGFTFGEWYDESWGECG
jgi:hypothetical protein